MTSRWDKPGRWRNFSGNCKTEQIFRFRFPSWAQGHDCNWNSTPSSLPFLFQTDHVAEDYCPTCNPQTKLNKLHQVKDPEETVHIISGLKTYTQYLVRLFKRKSSLFSKQLRGAAHFVHSEKSLSAQLPSLMFLHFKLESEHLIITRFFSGKF